MWAGTVLSSLTYNQNGCASFVGSSTRSLAVNLSHPYRRDNVSCPDKHSWLISFRQWSNVPGCNAWTTKKKKATITSISYLLSPDWLNHQGTGETKSGEKQCTVYTRHCILHIDFRDPQNWTYRNPKSVVSKPSKRKLLMLRVIRRSWRKFRINTTGSEYYNTLVKVEQYRISRLEWRRKGAGYNSKK